MSDAIHMPVTALGKDCVKCPELNIIVTRFFYSDNEIIHNNLKCEHYERCCFIRDRLKGDNSEK